MTRTLALSLFAATSLSFAAVAAPTPHRVRGTVQSMSNDSLVVQQATGGNVTVALSPDTKYATVTKSDLAHVEKDSYIGTATKTVGEQLVALEVLIFPAAMRGAGDGHYPWDKINDTTMSGAGMTASQMTNGNIDTVAPAQGGKQVQSSMTNGNVDSTADKSGAKQITVSYKGGKQTIVVPPTAPIVTLKPAEMSAVKQGDVVFVNGTEDGGKMTGRFVAIGSNGVVPPM